jgi:hypothetical protein
MFPRHSFLPIRYLSKSPSRYIQFRNVSLSLFRDKKPSSPPEGAKCGVPSIIHTGTADSVYPSLRLDAAVSARPKRETRRIPLFPEGDQYNDIKGDSAGDDAWVLGKYYLGR